MGTDTEDTAGTRIGLLHRHFRDHPRTGPAERPTRRSVPGTPVNLAIIDHLTASVTEVTDHTRAVNPDATPLPERVEDVYRWYMANTAQAPEAARQRRDAVICRQQLEHALAMGDTTVIRPHRCPSCATFGLFWQEAAGRAMCVNRDCAALNGGIHRTWTLARLAYAHVAAEKSLRGCAT